ncbi:porphobilinogen synthase [Candidatus Clavichlamydia salmonicola]|uniref:porphobilinogen synthase n=1 Tax=Candidatus Clavichlamydia salmonicola TaxID=469812 RepID=UPI0018911E54|nr:porphobilinogen synthase [Candidatus Clavichlamydia salmonicola]
MNEIPIRPRRNRKNQAIRFLVKEFFLSPQDLIYPIFIQENSAKEKITSKIPNLFLFNAENVLKEIERIIELGIGSILLFPCVDPYLKDPYGSFSFNPNNILLKTIQIIKKEYPKICVITDLSLTAYTSHGHDGLCDEYGNVLNDDSVRILGQLAVLHAESGVDMVFSSGMMDGKVRYIRKSLDQHGFFNVSIMSSAIEYASCFYSPFREILGSKITFGNKKNYQMDPANRKEALREVNLDEEEGADILVVKPGLPCLDIISSIRNKTNLPLALFQVSGEYIMIMNGVNEGWLSQEAFVETAICMKRAGADMIISFAAPLIAQQLIETRK